MAPTVPIDFVGQKESKKFGLSQSMGKSRKFSKGHSSGFIPDYRHGVETMGESEGFGSSGRVETEMIASENSYAPKRKCVSLNLVGYESFGVPMQVLSLSKMSKSERKNLELRLKTELEQVRIIQRKVASFSSNTVLLSPHSDIRSCSDGLKRPPLEGLPQSVEPFALQSKKKVPGGRHGARPKNGSSGHVEAVKPAAQANPSNTLLLKQCESLLNRLMIHQYGWVFNTPVDIVKLNIPDYFTIIKHPMDLGTVKSKITSGDYSSPLAFAADVRLTFANAMKYNPPGNDVHVMADSLNKYFEVRWKNIEKKLSVVAYDESMPSSTADGEIDTLGSVQPPKKKKITPTKNKVKAQPVWPVMTDQQKQNLSAQLETLLTELPESIIDFLKEQSSNDGRGDEEEIEIDIDALSNDTLFKLRKLLDDYLLKKQKSQAKAELCEMELINVSGLSNSSLQPYKVEEDVDIVGGKDPPVSSYPPIEIQKEAAHNTIKCSHSSSSISESGSSSSDSDSGSSSCSEPNAVKASAPGIVSKGSMAVEDTSAQKGSANSDLVIRNQSIEGVAQTEVNFQDMSLVAEADGHPEEEESAPPERQVSPEKMYRAALLRNRFADTILKARAKALEKDEKLDPEKLQKEKEELERRQKEEKARLQAEAKAAEEAKRKAAAEAAAEAKRIRELEREAARLALQQMEKTVEINENSQFMEDLEMLRTTNDEEVPSFMEETLSPERNPLNALGSFNLRSNPLEQLGLFMKDDEEEEETAEKEPLEEMGEGEPPKCTENLEKDAEEAGKDVEEGEID
ncbi:unnamed protein product [Linum trigynum]|uniref:Transcription factor GTE10-like n=1 Tax=Linum trigynum TaxID=586398 RepID=A0AAV2ETI4_9ROSI